jgi:hypothetical protein
MPIMLKISSSELDEERIQSLTLSLCKTITKETDIEAELAKSPAKKGERGEPITVGLIIITALSSGSAVALFNLLKSYFEREPSIKVIIKREDGVEVLVDAKNIRSNEIKEILGSL